jgi:diaminopimelate decarboxylase
MATLPDALRRLIARLDRLPAYVYDLTSLRSDAAAIAAALTPETELLYAAKANPDPRILGALRPYVDGVEVSSGGELAHVREALPDVPLAFGGPGKTADELLAAVRHGVQRIHVESPGELARLAGIVRLGHLRAEPGVRAEPGTRAGQAVGAEPPAVDVLLRVNLPVRIDGAALTMGGGPTQFGMDEPALEACTAMLADAPGIRLRGVHAHLASGLEAGTMIDVARQVLAWARPWCARHRIRRPEINLGGGMAVDYAHPVARFDWARFGSELAALSRSAEALEGERLRIEPGRAVSAYCGWYITEVLDLKRTHGEWFAVVRGGTQHLRTPVTKGHDQPFTVLGRSGLVEADHAAGDGAAFAGEPVTVVGQLCTPKDVFARRRRIDRLAPGDVVAFAMAGAYAWNISHHEFLMHPPPGFHYLDDRDGDRENGQAASG